MEYEYIMAYRRVLQYSGKSIRKADFSIAVLEYWRITQSWPQSQNVITLLCSWSYLWQYRHTFRKPIGKLKRSFPCRALLVLQGTISESTSRSIDLAKQAAKVVPGPLPLVRFDALGIASFNCSPYLTKTEKNTHKKNMDLVHFFLLRDVPLYHTYTSPNVFFFLYGVP